MNPKEEKQIARRRRERRLRVWLTTLSWTTPVVAFGSFFTIWHHISNAVNPPQQPKTSISTSIAGSDSTNIKSNSVLFQIGSSGQQVSNLQEQLSELGYFHHSITQYYGSVTADAVMAFQADHNLSQTGTVDSNTLSAIQMAIKNNSTQNLIQSNDNRVTQNNPGGGQAPYDPSSSVGGHTLSQQQSPVTTTSAS